MKELGDREIIDKVLAGNHELFGVIIDRYERPVAAVIRGLLGNCPEAEEVGQDAFIKCFQSLGKFRGDSTLKTYIIRIALNLSLNELKRRKKELNRTILFNDAGQMTLFSEDRVQERNEMRDIINSALSRLEIRQREVIVLRIIEGYSTIETAKILKVPVGTVLSRLSRAQVNMRKLIGHNRF